MTRAPTRSGLLVDLFTPDPARILLTDITESLAKLNRWTGSTEAPYSVAQHSVMVANLMAAEDGPLAGLYGALHDAHEYLIGNIEEQTRLVLSRRLGPEFDDMLHALKRQADAAIHAAFDVDYPRPRHYELLLDSAHDRIEATEVRDLLAETYSPCDFGLTDIARPALKQKLVACTTWVKAEAALRTCITEYHAGAGIRRTRAFPE
jgi:hypothetical protein